MRKAALIECAICRHRWQEYKPNLRIQNLECPNCFHKAGNIVDTVMDPGEDESM